MVGTSQRMGAHYGPLYVLRHVIEESLWPSVLQVGEEASDIVGLDRHFAPLFWQMCKYLINHSTLSWQLEATVK